MFKRPAPGFLVDKKYRLLERIGGGGMGDVFRAEVVGKGAPRYAMRKRGPVVGACVAIKILHQELAGIGDVAARFFHEAQAVNRVRHPNIVEVIEIGTADVGPYLVMEYLEGESLGGVLARMGRLDSGVVIALAVPVLEALDAAHRAGIIHRDLKPENVFLAQTPQGPEVRLLDFGIAKVMAETTAVPRTRTGVVYGTPDYLSPEQATGDGILDGRSDLFAVGVLTYELLTGRRPFSAPTAVATAFRVVHADPPLLSESGITVDPRLVAIVARLLEKEPAERFQDAADASRAFEALLPERERRDPTTRRDRLSSIGRRRGSEPESATRMAPRPAAMPPPVARRPAANAPAAPPTAAPTASPIPAASVKAPAPEVTTDDSHSSLRPLPVEHHGRYQVLGMVINSVDSAIRVEFGDARRNRVLDEMPPRHAWHLRNGLINALVGYDLEVLQSLLEAATTTVRRDAFQWRHVGASAVDGALAGVLRTLIRPASLESVLQRGLSIWTRLFSFGVWSVEARPSGRVAVRIDEFEPASLPLRLWIMGVVEEVARRAQSCDIQVSITSGDTSFAPTLSWELTPLYGSSVMM